MSIQPGYTRDQADLVTVVVFGIFDQPIKKFTTIAFCTLAARGNEVVDLKILAGRQPFRDSETGHRLDLTLGEISQLVPGDFCQSPNCRYKFVALKMLTQLSHDRITIQDFLI